MADVYWLWPVAWYLIDDQKAFDLINHEILLDKLAAYGVDSKELALIKDYLTHHTQFVELPAGEQSLSR